MTETERDQLRQDLQWEAFVDALRNSLDAQAKREFGPIERATLRHALRLCGLSKYPESGGPQDYEEGYADSICSGCGRSFGEHPSDWRVIGYGGVPFLNVLCDGRRVKL